MGCLEEPVEVCRQVHKSVNDGKPGFVALNQERQYLDRSMEQVCGRRELVHKTGMNGANMSRFGDKWCARE